MPTCERCGDAWEQRLCPQCLADGINTDYDTPTLVHLTVHLLDQVAEIHTTDEYTGRCLDGCIACQAGRLARWWRLIFDGR